MPCFLVNFTRQQFKNMKEKCAEQPIPSCPPIQRVLANLPQLHPQAWWCSAPSLAGFGLSVRVSWWGGCLDFIIVLSNSQVADFSAMYSSSDMVFCHVSLHRLTNKSNKCTVSKILQILVLFSSAHPLPTVSKKNGQKAGRFLGLPRLAWPFTASEGRVLS